MPEDLRTRYFVLQPLTTTDGSAFWMRVGYAYRNPDGTIDAYFDAIIVGHRFRLRELAANETMGVAESVAPS